MSRHDHPSPPAPQHVCDRVDLARWSRLLRLRDQGHTNAAIARELGVQKCNIRVMLDRAENRLCSGVLQRSANGDLEWSPEYLAASKTARLRSSVIAPRGENGRCRAFTDRGVSTHFDVDRAALALRLANGGMGQRRISKEVGMSASQAGALVRATRFYLAKGWLTLTPEGGLSVASSAPRVRRGVPNSKGAGGRDVGRLPPARRPEPDRVVDMALAEKALAARMSGESWEAIAAECGRSVSHVHTTSAMALHVEPDLAKRLGAEGTPPAARPAARTGMLVRLVGMLRPSGVRQGRDT